ncbi:hypothetical protein GCM10011594_41410 [Nakamurella endophytica]|uniref:Response regulatory domain-containing protein n=1 Tax=Nakamurella endophytica TaxID=1748367 RepID=A0A917WNQ7_9ACTN|nr:hypothetical protein GCM10011594_41410 [Nakamurella endophytica]
MPRGSTQAALTVLVVDDEEDQRSLLTTHVTRAGCRPVPVASAEQALVEIATLVPDVAVIDLNLPGMDGRTLARIVRERFPDCALVITSVLDPQDYPEADAVLPKPFTRSRLLEVLQDVVRTRPR